MSQENVEIVRSIYDAWARNELPGPAHLLDAQIVYVNPPDAIEPGTRHGLAAFSRAVEQVFQEGGWDSWRIEPESFTPSGDRVAVELSYQARGRGSGVEVEGRMSALWTIRDGKVVRFEWFLAPTGAFEAAGLRADRLPARGRPRPPRLLRDVRVRPRRHEGRGRLRPGRRDALGLHERRTRPLSPWRSPAPSLGRGTTRPTFSVSSRQRVKHQGRAPREYRRLAP